MCEKTLFCFLLLLSIGEGVPPDISVTINITWISSEPANGPRNVTELARTTQSQPTTTVQMSKEITVKSAESSAYATTEYAQTSTTSPTRDGIETSSLIKSTSTSDTSMTSTPTSTSVVNASTRDMSYEPSTTTSKRSEGTTSTVSTATAEQPSANSYLPTFETGSISSEPSTSSPTVDKMTTVSPSRSTWSRGTSTDSTSTSQTSESTIVVTEKTAASSTAPTSSPSTTTKNHSSSERSTIGGTTPGGTKSMSESPPMITSKITSTGNTGNRKASPVTANWLTTVVTTPSRPTTLSSTMNIGQDTTMSRTTTATAESITKVTSSGRTEGENEFSTSMKGSESTKSNEAATETSSTRNLDEATATTTPSIETTEKKDNVSTRWTTNLPATNATRTATVIQNSTAENTRQTVNVTEGRRTMTTVEDTVATTKNSSPSLRTTPSVKKPTTREPLFTSPNDTCPEEFFEGDTFCLEVTPSDHSQSYSRALTYCQRSERMDLLDGKEIQQNLKTLNGVMKKGMLQSNLLYHNEHGSALVRTNRTIRVVALNETTRFTIGVATRLGMSNKSEPWTYIGVCRLPKIGQAVSCDLSVFNETGVPSLSLPPLSIPLTEGTWFHAQCPPGPKGEIRSIRFDCSTRGHIEPHPSIYTCEYEREPLSLWEYENAANPRYQKDCSHCHPFGSDNCTMVEGKGAECHCKDGWRTYACWLSPDFCKEKNCSGNGVCRNNIDHGLCECSGGFAGEDCQINKTAISWNDPLKAQIFSRTTFATATLCGVSLLIFVGKLIVKVVIIGEGEDPQEAYQEIRSMLNSVACITVLLFKHPDLFKVHTIGCRFYFWSVTMCYTVGQLFWAQEAFNVRSCCLARNTNQWDYDFYGKKRRKYDYLYRVVPTYLFGGLFVMAISLNGWELLPAKWTCLGVFSQMTTNIWMPLVMFNGLVALATATVGEYAARVHVYRPHYKVMTHHFFEVFDPFTRERVDKVFRNLPFIIIGPFLHFLTWLFISLAADQLSALYENFATVFTYLYTVHNIIQSIVTTPAIWYKLTCMMMKWAPASYQPAREKLFLWTKDEVVNIKDPNWISKLKRKQKHELKEHDEKETRVWNEHVMKEFPNAPSLVIPSHEGRRRWNCAYLEERLETRMPPEECAYEVLKKEMDAGMLDGTDEEDSQMRSIWARFHLYVPSTDNLDMSKRVDRDKVRTALASFDFDPSSCEEIRTLQQILLDEYDAPYVQKFMKMPHPKMDYQIVAFDEAYGEYLEETNAAYDRIYDDDEFVLLAMTGLSEEEKEGVKRTLNIVPGILETGTKSRNPRKDLNLIYYDEENIGFIGPTRSATAPLEPVHKELITKQRHYARIADGQWVFMELAANRIKEARQLRTTYRDQLKKDKKKNKKRNKKRRYRNSAFP